MSERTRFEHADPILRVADMARSLTYYVNVLGFRNADWGGDEFTCVSRDHASIYLSQGDQGQPGTWVWVGVEDAAALYAGVHSERRDDPASSDQLPVGVRDASGGSLWARAPIRIGAESRPADE